MDSLIREKNDLGRQVDLWNALYLGFLLLTLVIGAFSAYAQLRTIRLSKRLISAQQQIDAARDRESEQALASVRGEAGAAHERAAKLELQSQQLKKANLILESDLAKFRKESAARRLTGTQRQQLRALLSHPVPLAVGWNPADIEAGDFARDLISALSEAHWKTVGILWTGSRYGVSLGAVESAVADLPEVRELRGAMREIGVPNEYIPLRAGDRSTSPPVEPHVLYLLIGPHPPLNPAPK